MQFRETVAVCDENDSKEKYILWADCKASILQRIINALPDKSSVKTVQYATIQEAVFSVDPTDAPLDGLDSDHVICVYCRPMSVPRLYNESREL
jgi:hypothetical protein